MSNSTALLDIRSEKRPGIVLNISPGRAELKWDQELERAWGLGRRILMFRVDFIGGRASPDDLLGGDGRQYAMIATGSGGDGELVAFALRRLNTRGA